MTNSSLVAMTRAGSSIPREKAQQMRVATEATEAMEATEVAELWVAEVMAAEAMVEPTAVERPAKAADSVAEGERATEVADSAEIAAEREDGRFLGRVTDWLTGWPAVRGEIAPAQAERGGHRHPFRPIASSR